jgi:hypothetical protein
MNVWTAEYLNILNLSFGNVYEFDSAKRIMVKPRMKSKPKTSRVLKLVAVIAVIVIATVAVYGGLTYPRSTLDFSVSFTIGADVQRKQFDVPFLNDAVEVQVAVSSGSALWNARILNGDETVWSHSAAQGGQTTYNSGWIKLSSGTYNFTFATAGAGSLSAQISLKSKGGFW